MLLLLLLLLVLVLFRGGMPLARRACVQDKAAVVSATTVRQTPWLDGRHVSDRIQVTVSGD